MLLGIGGMMVSVPPVLGQLFPDIDGFILEQGPPILADFVTGILTGLINYLISLLAAMFGGGVVV